MRTCPSYTVVTSLVSVHRGQYDLLIDFLLVKSVICAARGRTLPGLGHTASSLILRAVGTTPQNDEEEQVPFLKSLRQNSCIWD